MKEEESIVKPDFRGPKIPGGYLVYLPYLPSQDISGWLKNSSKQTIGLPSAKLYYLKDQAVLVGSLGAPAAISSLEKIRLAGLKKIVLLSYCGSLSEPLKIGQAFVPLQAASDEGTSRHYLSSKSTVIAPPGRLTARLIRYLKQNSLPFKTGAIVSTDAPYRETPTWMRKMQKKGLVAVDMEASAVFAFGHFYKIAMAALFLVSDELFSGRWQNGLRSQELEQATLKYFKPLLDKPFL
ncbi:MAG: nucleoside phosphorylase [Candidatus Aminicenantes bacterium]|nr:nucleoside phosphorylase [Candidatus Aminicenantes bacterium]